MARKSFWLLLGILLLGLAIRVYRIISLPMYGDELTMVYDTYSILKTGHDQTGEILPLTFSMGAGRPAGYVYFSLPFVAIFGPTALGVRSLSLISGLGIVMFMYFLGKKLFSQDIGLTASFLAAISPWDIALSRGGFEAHFALFLAVLGIVLFIYAKEKPLLYIPWALSWGAAIHTYPTFKLTLPLMLILIIWYVGRAKRLISSKYFLAGVAILILFGGLAARETLRGKSEQRFSEINLFTNSQLRELIIQKINYERKIAEIPNFIKPVLYNRPIEYSLVLLDSYSKNISLDFLFLHGDRNPRHNPGESGLVYLIELPLIFVALFHLWKEKRKERILILGWILITPLATMFLIDTHGLRNALMIPPLLLLTSYGLTKITKPSVVIFAVFILAQLIFILQRVYFVAPTKFASFWSSQAKEAVELALAKKDMYEAIIISKRIDSVEYAYPVYTRTNPKTVMDQYGEKIKKYGNIHITDLENIPSISGYKKVLVIAEGRELDVREIVK